MSEMEFLDLAPGDPISQGGSLREFRYSQLSQCPGAPFNTAEPEYLPSQFHLSPSLATSPPLEFEGHKYMVSDGGLGEPSSSLSCSQRESDVFAEGVECSSKHGEQLQSGPFNSDSLKLPFFDAHPGSKERESSPEILDEEALAPDVGVSGSAQQDSHLPSPIQRSPRRICCDSRLLEEETQVFDVVALDLNQQDSHLLSITQQLQLARQTTAAEPENSLSVLGVKQGCHVAAEDFADICHRWHNRRRIAPSATVILSSFACTGLPSEATHEIMKPSTSSVFDADHFRGQPTDLEPENPGPSCASNQKTFAAIEDVGTLQRCHNKRRISLAALTNLNSSTNIRFPVETKQGIIKPSTSETLDGDHFRCQSNVVEPENASPSTSPNQKILAAVEDDADIVQRWRNRKRIALPAITNLSSSLDKKLKQAPDRSVELGGRLQSTELEDEVVKDPLLNDNENLSVPQCRYDTPCMDANSAKSGSETIEEDVNVNDDTDDCCDSKLLRRKLSYSRPRGIKSFLQPVTAGNKSARVISSSNEAGVSKQEHVEEKWTYPKKYRVRGRQRTMDAWIK